MSWELVAEVLDHAPHMTPAERLLLVAIAEKTRVRGKAYDIATSELQRRTRLSKTGLRSAFARLAKSPPEGPGINVRVPLGVDSRGQPLYAVPGRVPTYLLPNFPAPPGCKCERCGESKEKGDVSASPADATASPTNEGDVPVSADDAETSPADAVASAADATVAPITSVGTEGPPRTVTSAPLLDRPHAFDPDPRTLGDRRPCRHCTLLKPHRIHKAAA